MANGLGWGGLGAAGAGAADALRDLIAQRLAEERLKLEQFKEIPGGVPITPSLREAFGGNFRLRGLLEGPTRPYSPNDIQSLGSAAQSRAAARNLDVETEREKAQLESWEELLGKVIPPGAPAAARHDPELGMTVAPVRASTLQEPSGSPGMVGGQIPDTSVNRARIEFGGGSATGVLGPLPTPSFQTMPSGERVAVAARPGTNIGIEPEQRSEISTEDLELDAYAKFIGKKDRFALDFPDIEQASAKMAAATRDPAVAADRAERLSLAWDRFQLAQTSAGQAEQQRAFSRDMRQKQMDLAVRRFDLLARAATPEQRRTYGDLLRFQLSQLDDDATPAEMEAVVDRVSSQLNMTGKRPPPAGGVDPKDPLGLFK